MIIADEQITKLVNDLNAFLKRSTDTLSNVLDGMCLARDLVSNDNEQSNISRIIDKISSVSEIISSFKISINDTNNQLRLSWEKSGSQEKYYYTTTDNNLTEKLFNFILMSFDREISQRISIIEESKNGYIYFCSCIKDSLHKIITNYMTT